MKDDAEDAAFGRNAPNSYILPQETPQNKQVQSDSWKYLQATLSENGRWTPVPQKEPPCKSSTFKSEDTSIPPQQLTVATAATDPTPPETNNNRRVLHDGCCVITMKS